MRQGAQKLGETRYESVKTVVVILFPKKRVNFSVTMSVEQLTTVTTTKGVSNMRTETHVSLRFPIVYTDNEDGFAYVDITGHDGLSCYTTNVRKARAVLRDQLKAKVKLALTHFSSWKQRVIYTKSGNVLIVKHMPYGWGYGIYGPNRKGGCWISYDSFDEALKGAESHAEQFGGIAWINNG